MTTQKKMIISFENSDSFISEDSDDIPEEREAIRALPSRFKKSSKLVYDKGNIKAADTELFCASNMSPVRYLSCKNPDQDRLNVEVINIRRSLNPNITEGLQNNRTNIVYTRQQLLGVDSSRVMTELL